MGILVGESRQLPFWEFDMVQQLLMADFIGAIVLIQVKTSDFLSRKEMPDPIGLRLFKRFERAWFQKAPDAFTNKRVEDLSDEFGRLRSSSMGLASEISSHQIDLLYLPNWSNKYALPDLPRYGVWRVQFGEDQYGDCGLPGFWEVMLDQPVTAAKLMVKWPGDLRERNVYHAVASTVPFSVRNNHDSMAHKACHFLHYRLQALYLLGDAQFLNKYPQAVEPREQAKEAMTSLVPSNFRMIGLFLRNCARYLVYKVKSVVIKRKFTILYWVGKLDLTTLDAGQFVALNPPGSKFWADPFVVEQEGNRFIFFEEGESDTGKGRIAVLQIDPSGRCGPPQTILDRPYHLSYPFILENNGEYFLIPESSANKTVELYRCRQFPHQWEFETYLLRDIVLEDSTLFFHEGIWWLFASSRVERSNTSNDQLVIFYSPNLVSGDWTAHPCNPVVTDVSNCRPAGKIFSIGGKIFRPAQNNASRQYGYSIQINEIELLTKTAYQEKRTFSISPDRFKKFAAIHTLNTSISTVVIDGIIRKR